MQSMNQPCIMSSDDARFYPYVAEYLNEAFLHFLLDHIETPLASDVQDKVPDLFVSLLLAFNLHVAMPTDNVLLRVLPDSPSVKVFTEKLLLLVNRAGEL